VLTPSAFTSGEALARAEALAHMLGSRPVVVSAEVHDRVLARTSHVPQLASTALAMTLEAGDDALAGPALADMTRLARSDSAMWGDILLSNRENVLEALDAYRNCLDDLAETVRAGDGAGLERLFDRGREVGASLPGSRVR
jgi:prephenate dehydrogenase